MLGGPSPCLISRIRLCIVDLIFGEERFRGIPVHHLWLSNADRRIDDFELGKVEPWVLYLIWVKDMHAERWFVPSMGGRKWNVFERREESKTANGWRWAWKMLTTYECVQ